MKHLKKVADSEKETRVYEIISSPETLDKLEQLLVYMILLGNIGASRSFNIFVDGDGSFHIEIEKKNGNVKIPVNLLKIQQIRIQWDKSSKMWYLLIIWDKEVESKVTGNNVMAIDLGLDNLATCVFKDNEQCIIFSGKHLKSKNAYYNKNIEYIKKIYQKYSQSNTSCEG